MGWVKVRVVGGLLVLGYVHAYYSAYLRRCGEWDAFQHMPPPEACEQLRDPSKIGWLTQVSLVFHDTRMQECREYWARRNQSLYPNPIAVLSNWVVHTLFHPLIQTLDALLKHHGFFMQVVLLMAIITLLLGLSWIRANKKEHNKRVYYYNAIDLEQQQQLLLMP